MSKENNLADFLKDLADAIRNKKNIHTKINPQNFAQEISSIQTNEQVVINYTNVVRNDIY